MNKYYEDEMIQIYTCRQRYAEKMIEYKGTKVFTLERPQSGI